MSKPVEIEFLMKDRLTPGLDKAAKGVDNVTGKASATNAELAKTKQQAMDLRNLIAMLENQLEELRLVGENASPDLDQSRNIARIEALQEQIKELEAQLKQLENVSENTSVVPPELPQAKKQFNGLHNSIQQMAREMPSLAMGPQMFFMAISNNLPIFTDELARARKEYDALIKTGEKATPVWKQVLSSLFSWQTALTTGIMLLVMYGDEIVEWTKDLFSAKKGVEEFNISLEEMVELEKDGRAQMVKTRFELDSVIDSLKNFTGSKEEEKNKVDELNRKYGESFGYYETTAQWLETLTKKSGAYVQMLLHQSKVQALVNKAAEADQKVAELKASDANDSDYSMGWFTKMGLYFAQSEMAQSGQMFDAQAIIKESNAARKEEAIKAAEAIRDGFLDTAKAEQDTLNKLMKEAGIGNHTKPNTTKVDPEKEAEQRLAAAEQLSEALSELRRRNQQDDIDLEKDSLQKKLAQIKLDYDTRKAEIVRREKELAELNKKAGGDGTLSSEQQAEIDEANRLNAESRKEAELAAYQEEAVAMREFLKEYGTYQQQKLAIAEEYAEKIGKAETEGERMILAKQRDKALASIDIKAAKDSVDWESVLSGFGGVLQEQIQPTIENLKRITQSEEFKNASVRDQQELYNIIAELERNNAKLDSEAFTAVAEDLELFRESLNRYNESLERRAEAEERLNAAKIALRQAEENGTDTSEFQAEVDAAQEAYDQANGSVEAFSDILDRNSKKLNDSATNISNSLNGVAGGLSKLKSGSLQASFEGLQDLGGIVGGKIGDALANMDPTGIIGGVLGIMDVLKGGVSSIFVDLQDMVFGAVDGILSDVLSGDIILKPLESTLKGVGGILDTVTFGGFSSLFGNGESDKNLERDIEFLTASNENLRRAIDNLADKMEDTAVSEASGVYERQKELLEQQMANTREMMQRSGAAYSNGFLGIGGSHSSNHKINEGMSSADWKRISDIVGRKVGSAGDFWKLSSEEMAKVADEATDLYSKIESLADDGHKNAAQYMDEYISYYKELEELQEAYYEKLTGMSFDSVRNSFKSTLLDMESDASTFSENIGETMKEGIIEGLMSEKYDALLKEWYKNFAESMEDGIMSEDEIETLRSQYQDIVNDALADRDALVKALGLEGAASGTGTTQAGKAGAFTTMTHEQGTKLEGLFTSGQMHWANIDDRVEDVSAKMDIASEHLRKIEENTGDCKDSLSAIKEDIKKIIRDGLKMK